QILSPPPKISVAVVPGVDSRSAPGVEGWPSGRRCGTGNAVYGQLYRGFESHPLRQPIPKVPRTSSAESGVQGAKNHVGRREGVSCERANEADDPLSAPDARWPC